MDFSSYAKVVFFLIGCLIGGWLATLGGIEDHSLAHFFHPFSTHSQPQYVHPVHPRPPHHRHIPSHTSPPSPVSNLGQPQTDGIDDLHLTPRESHSSLQKTVFGEGLNHSLAPNPVYHEHHALTSDGSDEEADSKPNVSYPLDGCNQYTTVPHPIGVFSLMIVNKDLGFQEEGLITAAEKFVTSLLRYRGDVAISPVMVLIDKENAMPSLDGQQKLREAGWTICRVDEYPAIEPKGVGSARYGELFSKLSLFRMISLETVIYYDLDMLAVGDLSEWYKSKISPPNVISGVEWYGLNAGMFKFHPSKALMDTVMDSYHSQRKAGKQLYYSKTAEQAFLNHLFQGKIQYTHPRYNVGCWLLGAYGSKVYVKDSSSLEKKSAFGRQVALLEKDTVRVIHYTGSVKPWASGPCSCNSPSICELWRAAPKSLSQSGTMMTT